jgi:hypothetical protein
VNEFVDECRREWKRLGVPDSAADEMAEELTADLAEAEAEGVSAHDVLGSSDARSFAARWATERGVVQGRRWTPRLTAAIATVALIPAIIGAVLLIASSASDERSGFLLPGPSPEPVSVWVTGPPTVQVATLKARLAQVDAEQAWQMRTLLVARDANDSGDQNHTLGSVLLIVGLALLAPLTLFSLWRGLVKSR